MVKNFMVDDSKNEIISNGEKDIEDEKINDEEAKYTAMMLLVSTKKRFDFYKELYEEKDNSKMTASSFIDLLIKSFEKEYPTIASVANKIEKLKEKEFKR